MKPSSPVALAPKVVHTSLSFSHVPFDFRQTFLVDSMMIGSRILGSVLIPNPTVSARVKAFVFTPRTRRLSSKRIFPGTPSIQEYPRRAFESVGMIIQRSVIGFAPGLVRVRS
jgi:hypothetical protein